MSFVKRSLNCLAIYPFNAEPVLECLPTARIAIVLIGQTGKQSDKFDRKKVCQSVSLHYGMRVRERERERQTDRQTERWKDTERNRVRQKDRQKERETYAFYNRERKREREKVCIISK